MILQSLEGEILTKTKTDHSFIREKEFCLFANMICEQVRPI